MYCFVPGLLWLVASYANRLPPQLSSGKDIVFFGVRAVVTGILFFSSIWLIIKKSIYADLSIASSLVGAALLNYVTFKKWLHHKSPGTRAEWVFAGLVIVMVFLWWSNRVAARKEAGS
jgi:peptidoglycan biosynthesis protein MviN/MurJ (putative lipid II flippase)